MSMDPLHATVVQADCALRARRAEDALSRAIDALTRDRLGATDIIYALRQLDFAAKDLNEARNALQLYKDYRVEEERRETVRHRIAGRPYSEETAPDGLTAG